MRKLLPAVLLVGLLASPAFGARPPEANRMQPGHLPTPFSADALREASPPGHSTVHLIQIDGDPPIRRISTFVDSNAEGATFRSFEETRFGEPLGEPREASVTWSELQAHASFPEAFTTVKEDRVSVPAGDFDCWLYTLTRPGDPAPAEGPPRPDTVMRFWFAKDLPGPPVKLEQEVGGKTLMLMTLVRMSGND